MRRYCLHALVVFIMFGMSGCGLVPSFPDLWPFNDEPVTISNVASQPAAEIVQASDEPEPVVEALQTPGEPEPLVETAQTSVTSQPLPTPGESDGATASVPGAVAYIISPAEGSIVTNPVRVLFGLDRMGIAPVSSTHEATGHHHLLINTELPPLDQPIPVDDNHRHFSGGQTETSLNLPIGQHTLQLLLGDHTHTPHQPPVTSRKISITVQ